LLEDFAKLGCFVLRGTYSFILLDTYTTELVEEKETPATKHSCPQKWRPNNCWVVEDTSEEEAGAL
jgi:hypothetical protein